MLIIAPNWKQPACPSAGDGNLWFCADHRMVFGTQSRTHTHTHTHARTHAHP